MNNEIVVEQAVDFTDGMSKELAVPVNVFSLGAGENDALAGDHQNRTGSLVGRWGPAVGPAESHGHRFRANPG